MSAGDREMRILEERKRKMVMRSIGWNWMATFCRVHFVRGSMVVCMDVTSTEVCALYASSSKPHRTSLAPVNMCLSCNYIVDERVGSASECSITCIKQTQDRRGSTGNSQSMFDESSSTQGWGVEHIWFGDLCFPHTDKSTKCTRSVGEFSHCHLLLCATL